MSPGAAHWICVVYMGMGIVVCVMYYVTGFTYGF